MHFLLLFAAALAGANWLGRPVHVSLASHLSLALELACLFSTLWLLEGRLRSGVARFVVRGVATLLAALILIDSWLLANFTMSLLSVLPHLAAHGEILRSLRQSSVTDANMVGALAVGVALFLAGGASSRVPVLRRGRPPAGHATVLLPLVLALLFVVEQKWAIGHDSRYPLRPSMLPLYAQVFTVTPGSLAVPDRRGVSETERECFLAQLRPARQPHNVLFVLLESFRRDVIDPTLTPNLDRLRREGLDFTNAYAEAVFTLLTWHVIFLDRPVWRFYEKDSSSPWPLMALRKTGYRVALTTATDFGWKGFDEKVVGPARDRVDAFFPAYVGDDEARDRSDDAATAWATKWIRGLDPSAPGFLMIQLDSTHWRYYFDPDSAVARPYASGNEIPTATDPGTVQRVYNRYQNAARQVDNSIGRLLAAIRARSDADRWAVIVVSDHGESFAPGSMGHASLAEPVRRIPLLMKLPGVAAATVDAVVSHRDIFPTLFDALGIDGLPAEAWLGASALPPARGSGAAITFSMNTRQAVLVTPESTTLLATERSGPGFSVSSLGASRYIDAVALTRLLAPAAASCP